MDNFIDVHFHWFSHGVQEAKLKEAFQNLRSAGLEKVAIAQIDNFGLDPALIKKLAPTFAREYAGPATAEEPLSVPIFMERGGFADMLVSMIDVRCLSGDVKKRLTPYVRRGYKGIKSLFMPESDAILGTESFLGTLGLSYSCYLQLHEDIFAFAREHALPIILHADVRHYAEPVSYLLSKYSEVIVDIAHFGCSRLAFRAFLENYDNCYSDPASLLPFIEQDPEGYRSYLEDYKEKILFGTDSFAFCPEKGPLYFNFLREVGLGQEALRRIVYDNPKRFLSL